jgi:glycosyltransferase involved in cell wall biosynthesis
MAQYPAPTETFISREIAELSNVGVQIWLYALRGECTESAPGSKLIYRKDLSINQAVLHLVEIMFRHPHRLLSALLGTLSCSLNGGYLSRTVWNAFRCIPLARMMQSNSISRVHSHFADIPTDTALFLSRLTCVPLSFSVHARDVFVKPRGLKTKCAAAKVIFACNSDAAAIVHASSGNVAVVHHGLDFSSGTWDAIHDQRSRKRTYAFQSSPARILTVCRLVPKKGLRVLIAALAILADRGRPFVARFAGEGPERESLLGAIARSHLSDQVRLLGALTQDQLVAQWVECDVLVQPSVIDANGDRDGIPNAMIEAMACGIPVVASDLPGTREIIRHGKTGFLCTPADPRALASAIELALSDLHKDVGEAGRLHVRAHFDVQKNTRQMLNAWDTCLLPQAGTS